MEIDHLLPGSSDKASDLIIRSSSEIEPFEPSISTTQWRLANGLVQIYGIAGEQCLCIDGKELVFAGTGLSLDETNTLIGRALAVICMQRGLLVFHAAVLEKDGRAIAISGRSGAGKSTLAMQLFQRGYRVVADDIAVCEIVEDRVFAQPLYPVTRRLATGADSADWRTIPGTRKQVSTQVPFCSEPRAIDRLFVIELSASMPLSLVDVAEGDTAKLLEAQCYRKGIARALLGHQGLRGLVSEASACLPLSRVTRPQDCRPDDLAELILDKCDRP